MRTMHERRICTEVAKTIARERGLEIEGLFSPEDDHDETAKIDLSLRIGDEVHAIEHTVIGPFTEFESWNVQLPELERAVSERLEGVLSSGRVSLLVPYESAQLLANRRFERALQADLTEEIARVLPDLIGLKRGRLEFSKKALNAPFSNLSVLYRDKSAGVNGFTLVVAIENHEIELARAARLVQQVIKKSGKLLEWKGRLAVTSLVLESQDIQLSSWSSIGGVLGNLTSHLQGIDNVYLVETFQNPWLLYPLKRKDDFLGSLWFQDLPQWQEISV